MIKVTYLFHSGYMVETDNYHLIFDYITDNCNKKNRECGRLCKEELHDGKKTAAFVSHAHCDHYDKSVLKLGDDISFIMSDDVKPPDVHKLKLCHPYETWTDDGLKVMTFGSTDQGVSFYVEADGYRVFHAGDLNWWHWEGESKAEQEDAKKRFFAEIEKIKKLDIQIAMFPVDPRLEHAYYYGGKSFIEEVKPDIFFPMHFQGSYMTTRKFKKMMGEGKTKIYEINRRFEEFSLTDKIK